MSSVVDRKRAEQRASGAMNLQAALMQTRWLNIGRVVAELEVQGFQFGFDDDGWTIIMRHPDRPALRELAKAFNSWCSKPSNEVRMRALLRFRNGEGWSNPYRFV
jgi:hypothetical protein